MDVSAHRTHLGYSNLDDGVHLVCSCGEDLNLGWDPSPADVGDAERSHLVEAADKLRRARSATVRVRQPDGSIGVWIYEPTNDDGGCLGPFLGYETP